MKGTQKNEIRHRMDYVQIYIIWRKLPPRLKCSLLPLLCLRLRHYLWQPVEALVARGVVWVV